MSVSLSAQAMQEAQKGRVTIGSRPLRAKVYETPISMEKSWHGGVPLAFLTAGSIK
jgi:hypothetical protein